jgi:hypothetical protein
MNLKTLRKSLADLQAQGPALYQLALEKKKQQEQDNFETDCEWLASFNWQPT